MRDRDCRDRDGRLGMIRNEHREMGTRRLEIWVEIEERMQIED